VLILKAPSGSGPAWPSMAQLAQHSKSQVISSSRRLVILSHQLRLFGSADELMVNAPTSGGEMKQIGQTV